MLNITNQQHAGRIAGKTVLFIGNECRYWTPEAWAYVAQVAFNLGIATISAKLMNGTQKWYGTPEKLIAISKIVTSHGVGFIPFGYCYGPAYGLDFVDAECAVLIEMQEAISSTQPDGIGFVCADLETEWNGRVDAAERFNAAMQNKHLLYLTSWANPGAQNWIGVLNVLRSCINAYIPQAYNDYLASAEYQQVSQDICIQDAVDLSYEFGGNNHPAQIAQTAIAHGHTTVWMWEWVFVGTYRQNLDAVIQVMKGASVSPVPQPVPVPTPRPAPVPPPPVPQVHTYTIRSGNNFGAIYKSLRNAGTISYGYAQFYQENIGRLDTAARARGYRNSNNANLIFPGTQLVY